MSDWEEAAGHAGPFWDSEEDAGDAGRRRLVEDSRDTWNVRRSREAIFLEQSTDEDEDEVNAHDRELDFRDPQTSPPEDDNRATTQQQPPPQTRASGSAAIRNILNDDAPEATTNNTSHGPSHNRTAPIEPSGFTYNATLAPPTSFGGISHNQDFELDSDLDDFVTLEDLDHENTTQSTNHEPEAMPPRNAARAAQTRRQTVVDLTSNSPPSSPQPPGRRKRSADETAEGDGFGKVLKRSRHVQGPVEEVDLLDEAPSVEEELLQAQRQAAIKAQQAEVSAGPLKIGKRQCIICMENYTNATATACGHFYCHECLIQALLAGEKTSDRGTGTCPVCRKPLTRNSKKKYDIIPISFMTKAQFAKNESRRNMY